MHLASKQDWWFRYKLLTILWVLLFRISYSQQDSILLFVSYDSTYYSEYIVMHEALVASGYHVDVRSAGTGFATTYTIGGDIIGQANMLGGSSYTAFQGQFSEMFGSTWNAALNAVPASIAVAGTVQEVSSMTPYRALVVIGGTGAVDYRVDGTYESQAALDASIVQATAEKLNELAVEALLQGKPVVGQCHGASIPAYWRVPGTAPNGFDLLGHSILSGSLATGFPEPSTAANLSNLNIAFRPEDKVVVGTPHESLDDQGFGDFKVITTRDWYPQTVAHAAMTLLNVLRSYPEPELLQSSISLLIIHGGAVDVDHCDAGNQNNDVPCNYGDDRANLPADYTDLVALYSSNEFSDSFRFTVSDVNLFSATPFDLNDQSDIYEYLDTFDVVFFYKHWSSMVTVALQNAIVDFADDGGGVVTIHHGLYNQDNGVIHKNILVDSLFEVHSPSATWSANRTTYHIYQVNYGHFVSTFGVVNAGVSHEPAIWSGNPPLEGSNQSLSLYQRFGLFDEIYNNMQFVSGVNFGHAINDITPLFSNDQAPAGQSHIHGFVKLVDRNNDETVGRVVYGSPGETIVNYQYPHPYAQFLRNAVYWARGGALCHAHTATWLGGDGNWDDPFNWSSSEVPNSCSDVVIPNQIAETFITMPEASDITIDLLYVGSNVVLEIPVSTTFTVLSK